MITLELHGTPYERGLQQAAVAAPLRSAALSWMTLRQSRVEKRLADAATLDFARDLHAYALRAAPNEMEELRGIAQGFDMAPFDLFCGWYAAIFGEIQAAGEGCTAIASGSYGQTYVVKNRDVPGETQRLQVVFRMSDRAWRGGSVLGVSSLGSSPCASSGINEAGLCVSDTQIGTRDHGIGLIRYVVMQRLLTECRNVPEALNMLRATRHAGGGSLVIADIQGRIAAVELGHRASFVQNVHRGTLARTNHFTGEKMLESNLAAPETPAGLDSRARLAAIEELIEKRSGFPLAGEAVSLMSSHDVDHPLCHHGYGIDQPKTISMALYDVGRRTLTITDGVPCASPAITYRIDGVWQAEPARPKVYAGAHRL